MTDPSESQSAVDHYESALEASCDTLISLQLIAALVASSSVEVAALKAQVTRAITSQRRAIAELRLAWAESANVPLIGFVLAPRTTDGGRRRR